ncbi:MAG: radical SAM family heme chaperone HemW [Campylobacter sputorum]|uniref:radical SAM family heme chaperone HemW n=1 Tax=Campylobacter sputorum TaxID=206 RepID=UPI000B77503A|nr:radical SAM family heme chaperone HemW [Campylobacter sputorum]ASM38028.1 oxygen-independent coproporphyrinogen III oxidase [Campylobacter sputorum bv. paraureolyticus LMG 11764]MDY6120239.1 radical SAM family heme chaperone HemW [Campylobacter sputorum]
MLLYIHIPFCEQKCPYCSFGSSVSYNNDTIKAYFDAIKREFEHTITILKDVKIQTMFIGGGTPSVVNSKNYKKLFKMVEKYLDTSAEITVEANPNSAKFNWLKDMKSYGVNRVSFGAQSFIEKKLKFLGRIHNSKDIFNAINNANKAGFKNINIDLMYGSKEDNKNSLCIELENLKKLNITHVSAYSLTLEENTPFYKKIDYAKDDENLAKFFIEGITNLGFKQYEISNFGNICKHNLGYWKLKNYIGLGAFSVGCIDTKRYFNQKNINEYIQNPTKKIVENLSPEDIKFEKIFLGLRSIVGVNKSILNEKEVKNAEFLVENQKLELKNGIFYNKNYLLSDELALFIKS